MSKKIRKVLAFMLAFAMVFNSFMSMDVVKANDNGEEPIANTVEGLVISAEEGVEDENEAGILSKRIRVESGGEIHILIGTLDGEGTLNLLTESDLKKLKITKDGKDTDVEIRLSNYENILDPVEEGMICIEPHEIGEYKISMDGSDDYVIVNVEYPKMAFTRAAVETYDISDPNVESKIATGIKKQTVLAGERNRLYVSVRTDSNPDINKVKKDYEIEKMTFMAGTNQPQVDENTSYRISADKKSAEITLKDKLFVEEVFVYAELKMKKSSYVNGEWIADEVQEEVTEELTIHIDNEVYTDGEGGKNFSAMFMPKAWYESGDFYTGWIDYPVYWVHSDSIQEAIDQLTDAASKEYADVYSRKRRKWKKQRVKNTGYIYIETNTPKAGKEMPKHYITSPGEIKGIMITAGGFQNASLSDTAESSGLDFMDSPILNPADFAKRLNAYDGMVPNKEAILATLAQIQSAGNGVVFEAGNAYEAKKSVHTYIGATTGKQHSDDYYYFDRTVKFTLNEQIFELLNVEGIYRPTYLEGINITASTTCGFVLQGDMGEIRIGYPEGFNPKDINIRITDLGDYDSAEPGNMFFPEDIPIDLSDGAQSYKDGHCISSIGKHVKVNGQQQEYGYQYDLYTYQINAETDVTGNISGVTINKDCIDPNAFRDLLEGEKKTIEEGGKLSVSVKADRVNEAEAMKSISTDDPDYQEKKDVQDSIAEIRNEIGAYNIKDGVTYYNLGIDTCVSPTNNSQENPNVLKTTSITESSKPVEIVVPVSFDSGTNVNKLRFMRSHKTKSGAFENEFFNMVYSAQEFERNRRDGICWLEVILENSEIILNLHIMSSRFSIFGLFEYEGEPEEVDLSEVAWNYKNPIAYDGKEHQVKLNNLPEGVKVFYTGNEKTETGTYIACAEFSVTDTALYKLPDTIPARLRSLDWEIKAASNDNHSGEQSGGSDSSKNGKGNETVPDKNQYAPVNTKIRVKTGTYVVTGKGSVAFKAPKNKKIASLKIASKVTYRGKSYNVTSISKNALKNCKKLKSVTIPASVKMIGVGAFEGCSKLGTVTIKSNNITAIGKNAFKNIRKKAKIKVPKKMKKAYKMLLKKAKTAKSVKVK